MLCLICGVLTAFVSITIFKSKIVGGRDVHVVPCDRLFLGLLQGVKKVKCPLFVPGSLYEFHRRRYDSACIVFHPEIAREKFVVYRRFF